jgi:uncharacterized membrane protein YfcA
MIFLIAVVAFSIEAALGFGSTVFAVAIGASFIPIAQLVPAFVPVNLALSTILALRNREHIAWRFLLVEIVPPVAIGAAIGLSMPSLRVRWVLAAVVIVLALVQLVRPHRLPRASRMIALAGGGLAHGLFGTGGPLVVYAAGSHLSRAQLRATLAILWLGLNIALLVSFARVELRLSAEIAAALPLGIAIGSRLHHRLPPKAVWAALLAAGVALLARVA